MRKTIFIIFFLFISISIVSASDWMYSRQPENITNIFNITNITNVNSTAWNISSDLKSIYPSNLSRQVLLGTDTALSSYALQIASNEAIAFYDPDPAGWFPLGTFGSKYYNGLNIPTISGYLMGGAPAEIVIDSGIDVTGNKNNAFGFYNPHIFLATDDTVQRAVIDYDVYEGETNYTRFFGDQVEGYRFSTGTTNNVLVINNTRTYVKNLSTEYGLFFGDGDSGLYENVDDQFRLAYGGGTYTRFTNTFTQWGSSGGVSPQVRAEQSTLTNPVFLPIGDDTDTGLGGDGAESITLIANGIPGVVFNGTSSNVGIITTAPQQTFDVYGSTQLGMTENIPEKTVSISGNIDFDSCQPPTKAEQEAVILSGTTGGTLTPTDEYWYSVVYYTAEGDTTYGVGYADNSVILGAGENAVDLSNLPIASDPRVIGRKLYRGTAGIYNLYGFATITNNVDTTYKDIGAAVDTDRIYRKRDETAGQLWKDGTLVMDNWAFGTSVGVGALSSLVSGNSLVAIGPNTLRSSTTGSNNVGVGYQTMYGLTTGSNNIGMGYSVMSGAHTGAGSNVAIGTNTMRIGGAVTSTNYNTAVGTSALRDNIVNIGNTALGMNAGYGTGGSYNIYLGHSAGYHPTPRTIGTYNIMIGSGVNLNDTSSSNQLNLGNVIYATGTATGTYPGGSGKVGIGTYAPSQELDVNGSINQTNGYAFINLPGGEMWNYSNIGSELRVIITNAGTYYNVSGLIAGDLNGFLFIDNPIATGGSHLQAEYPGVYDVSVTGSFKSIANGGLFGFSLGHNWDQNTHRECYIRAEASTDVMPFSINCKIDLDAGDNITLMVENEQGLRDVLFGTLNINADWNGELGG